MNYFYRYSCPWVCVESLFTLIRYTGYTKKTILGTKEVPTQWAKIVHFDYRRTVCRIWLVRNQTVQRAFHTSAVRSSDSNQLKLYKSFLIVIEISIDENISWSFQLQFTITQKELLPGLQFLKFRYGFS